jgi:hypothetical protein
MHVAVSVNVSGQITASKLFVCVVMLLQFGFSMPRFLFEAAAKAVTGKCSTYYDTVSVNVSGQIMSSKLFVCVIMLLQLCKLCRFFLHTYVHNLYM